MSCPDVVCAGDGFRFKRWERYVRRSLRTVSADLTRGLGSIVIRELSQLSRTEKRQRLRGGGLLRRAAGAYYEPHGNEPARIELFPDRILATAPWPFRTFPLAVEMQVAMVLYHEIGHHVAWTRKERHPRSESRAEEWEKKLFQQSLEARWWMRVLRKVLAPVAVAVKGARGLNQRRIGARKPTARKS